MSYGRSRTNRHRIQLCCNICRESIFTNRNSQIIYCRSTFVNQICRISSNRQGLLKTSELLLNSISIRIRSCDRNINIFYITTFNSLFETRLHFIIFRFHITLVYLDFRIRNSAIRICSQLNLTFFIFFLKSHLSFYRIRQEAMRQKALVLMGQSLLAKSLLYKCPIVIDLLILLLHLRILCRLIRFIFCEKLLQGTCIETTSLLIDKRSLEKHWVCTLIQDILHLFVSYSKTKFLSLLLDKFRLNIGIPYHILHLIHLILRNVLGSLLHFDDVRVLINKFLEIIYTNFFT